MQALSFECGNVLLCVVKQGTHAGLQPISMIDKNRFKENNEFLYKTRYQLWCGLVTSPKQPFFSVFQHNHSYRWCPAAIKGVK